MINVYLPPKQLRLGWTVLPELPPQASSKNTVTIGVKRKEEGVGWWVSLSQESEVFFLGNKLDMLSLHNLRRFGGPCSSLSSAVI